MALSLRSCLRRITPVEISPPTHLPRRILAACGYFRLRTWLGSRGLTVPDAGFRGPPRVWITVGRPGVDHDGIESSLARGALCAVTATRKSPAMSVAQAIARITSALGSDEGAAQRTVSC